MTTFRVRSGQYRKNIIAKDERDAACRFAREVRGPLELGILVWPVGKMRHGFQMFESPKLFDDLGLAHRFDPDIEKLMARLCKIMGRWAIPIPKIKGFKMIWNGGSGEEADLIRRVLKKSGYTVRKTRPARLFAREAEAQELREAVRSCVFFARLKAKAPLQ